jgi:RNA-directed DNA polymerase
MKYNQDILFRLFQAYFNARKNKRSKHSQLAFEWQLEQFIFELYDELVSKKYQPGNSICFIVEEPVKREVFAADFRDRIVHHFIYNILSPLAEKIFLYDVYSCRKEKGTLFGVKRAYGHLQSVTSNFKEKAYVLKLDISGYFMNINKQLLFQKAQKLIDNNEINLPIQSNLLKYLVNQNIFHNPTVNCRFKSSKKLWRGLPKNKSLFTTQPNCGLPIGNLTSQLYGNLYLSDFDHYVKKELKIKHYGRYVDDFYLMHQDKSVLTRAKDQIIERLKQVEKLEVHPNKIYLQKSDNGFSFLGIYILPHRRYVGRRIKKGLYDSLSGILDAKDAVSKSKEMQRHVSYRGFLKHHNCKKLENTMQLLSEYAKHK